MLGHDPQGYESPQRDLYRIGEVSRLTETKPFVLRYWETEFPMLQPVKTPKGHRLYRSEDIEMVRAIKRLLYDEGFTIAGARRHLSDNGATLKDGPAGGNGHSRVEAGNGHGHANGGNGQGHGHREENGNERGLAKENGHAEAQAAGAVPASRHVLRELRTELAAILTLLRGQ